MELKAAFPHTVFTVLGIEVRDTVVVSWMVMGLLVLLSFIVSRRLRERPGFVQNVCESVVELFTQLVEEVTPLPAQHFVPFIGTLGTYLMTVALVSLIPGVRASTRDVSVTAALAAIVFVSVHVYGVRFVGRRYLRSYIEPSWFLLPFNIIGDVSRTVALALRLFGNMLSGELLVAIMVLLAGLIVPVVMQLFGLLIGVIQAYVFTLLAMVYIAAGLRVEARRSQKGEGL